MKLTSLVLVLAVAGFLATSSLGAADSATGIAKAPPKCVKWAKKHGKRVCVKRAKPKPKPKPTGGTTTTTTTPATPAGPPSGHYSANTAQNTTIQFDLAGSALSHVAISELDSTCNPGGWLDGNHLTLSSLTGVLSASNAFSVSTPISFTDGSTGTLAINGTVTLAGSASGTLTWSHTSTTAGTTYTCSSGTVTWSGGTGASAPAAPTGPKLGHYTALTSQNDHIQFTLGVDANGYLEASHVSIDEIDESCTPPANLTLTGFDFGAFPFFVNASGHMHGAFTASDETFVLDATIDSTGHATGGLHDALAIPSDGTTFACDSGAVTWTGGLG